MGGVGGVVPELKNWILPVAPCPVKCDFSGVWKKLGLGTEAKASEAETWAEARAQAAAGQRALRKVETRAESLASSKVAIANRMHLF